MPAFMYRWYFGAHSVKSLKRNVLRFSGIDAVSETLIGMVGDSDAGKVSSLIGKMEGLGRAGA